MVPGSLGCGLSGLAAATMVAPSRAARRAIASPMPREAPVMNRVLPRSDIALPLAREEGLEGRPRLRRLQPFAENPPFLIEARDHLLHRRAHQAARGGNGRTRQGREPPR